MDGNAAYLHGYTDEEAQRLIDQAEFLAPWVFDGVSFDGVGSLLEVGVGVGAETRLIRARWPQMRVVGVDISEEQLAHARRVLSQDVQSNTVELVRAAAADLPLPSGSTDAGFICWLLEHVPDPLSVVRECARVVRPGGTIYITEVYNQSLMIEPTKPTIEKYWAALNATQRRSGGHPNVGARLGELAAAAGLEIISHRFLPILGDARDPAGRLGKLRYFRACMKSAEAQICAAGAFDQRDLPAVWAEWDAVEAMDDVLFCYTSSKLQARVPLR